MKKVLSFLVLLLFIFTLVSCNKEEKPPVTPDVPDTPETGISKDSVKILAIGNSFSDNAMNQLYPILKAFGVKEIVLGNLYIGGCTIATHYANIERNAASYTYRKNDSRTETAGRFVDTPSTKILTALQEEDWQVVTLQQASHDSGMIGTYKDDQINLLVDYAKAGVEDENLKIAWHMTWAYQGNATHSAFPKYDRDQMLMYNVITGCVQQKIATNDRFDYVIPAGTAIQNARTSYLGDKLTADGYHLNALGEFIIGVTWVLQLTGWSIDDLNVELVPAQFKDDIEVIKESAVNAVAKPYEVTESKIKEDPNPSTANPGGNIDLSKYELLEWEAVIGYWNSKDSANSTKVLTNQSLYITNTTRFSKEDIPVGSIIVLADDWQYRPDGWTSDTANADSRPGETQETMVTVDAAWWGNYIYRSFNISKAGKPTLTADDLANIGQVFKIYVPKN